MKKFKNLKSTAMGFVAGAMCVGAVSSVSAQQDWAWNDGSEDWGNAIVCFFKDKIAFKVDGKVVYPTGDNRPINCEGKTYVPMRYLAELIGCEVEWNGYMDCIEVTTPKKTVVVEKPVEKIVYVNKEGSSDGKVYSDLPLSIKKKDYTVTLRSLERSNPENVSRLYIDVENEGRNNVQLQPDSCKLTIDGKEYPLTKFTTRQDQRWYNNIRKDEEVNGFLAVELTPKGFAEGSLTISMLVNEDGDLKTYEHTFNFLNPNSDEDDD